jgi:hypothetical protein
MLQYPPIGMKNINMEKNTSGIITYGDMKTSRVNLIDIINYPAYS